MTSSEANVAESTQTAPKSERKAFRRLRRVGLGLLLAMVLAYGLLPWLLPKRWLAERIAGQIASVMNRRVRIDELRLSWIDGVVIGGLTIDRRAGFGDGPFLRVKRIETEFAPLQSLLGKSAEALRITEPEVWVVVATEDGVQRLNIADLGAEGTERAPTGAWSAERAMVHLTEHNVDGAYAATGAVGEGPARANTIDLQLGLLACELDGRTGKARWTIRGRLPAAGDAEASEGSRIATDHAASRFVGGLSTDGSLTLPKLKPGVRLSGGGRIRWERLDLASLPVHLIPGTTVRRLTGFSEGMLDVRVHEDLHVDIEFHTGLSDLAVYPTSKAEPERLANAHLAATGVWNPHADVLAFQELECRIPGLRVQSERRTDRSPVRFALHGDRRVELDLVGKIEDLVMLRRSVPEFDALLGPETEARGACEFEFRYHKSTVGDRLRLEIDGTNAELDHPNAVHVAAGDPASLRLDLALAAGANRLTVRELQARVGMAALHASGEVPLPHALSSAKDIGRSPKGTVDEELSLHTLLHETRGRLRINTQAADLLTRSLPALAEPLRGVRLAGPMSLALDMNSSEAEPDATFLHATLNVPPSSTFSAGEWIEKPRDKALSASTEMVLAREPRGKLTRIGLDLRCGRGRASIDPASSRGRLSVQRVTGADSVGGTVEGSTPSRYIAHGHMAARVEIESIEELLEASPKLKRHIREQGQPLTGDCTMAIGVNLKNTADHDEMVPELWRVHADVDATALGIDLADEFRKGVGEPTTIAFDYLYDRNAPIFRHRHEADFRIASLTGHAEYRWGARHEHAIVRADTSDVPDCLGHLPRTQRQSEEYRLTGGASFALRSRRDPDRHVIDLDLEATRLGMHLPGEEPVDKAPGVPCQVRAVVESLPTADESKPHEIMVRQLSAALASCRFAAKEGRIVTQPGMHRKLTGDYMARNPRWWIESSPFRELAVRLVGTVVFDATLRSLSPAIDRVARDYDLIGTAESEMRFALDPDQCTLSGEVRADRLNINASPHLVKPPGTKLAISFDLASRTGSTEAGTATSFVVREYGVRAGNLRCRGQGDFWVQHEAEATAPRLGGFSLSAEYEVPALEEFQKLTPGLVEPPLTGSVRGTISLAGEGDRVRLGPSTIVAEGVRSKLGDEPLTIDGEASLSREQFDSQELRVRIGENELTVAGHLEDLSGNPRGSLFLIADSLDLDTLRDLPDKLQGEPTTTQPATTTQTSAERQIALAQPVFEFLKRCDVTGRAHIHKASVTSRRTEQLFLIDELVSDFKVASGRVSVPFQCVLNGGLVKGEFSLTADRPNPYFDLQYEAVAVRPRENVKALVLYDFPGLHASGPVTLIDSTRQRFFNEPNALNHPVGEGDWIIEGGAYVGRAAPLWLTKIFPGLNTARYEFTRMHDWFKKHVDGRVDHHMIYQGSIYNIYMKGHSMATTGRSRYEVGIDLLAGYESKYWSETGQGRVALFTADARVENGVEVEKTIRFVPIHRVLTDVFFRNNVVTTAYYALKKQALGVKD